MIHTVERSNVAVLDYILTNTYVVNGCQVLNFQVPNIDFPVPEFDISVNMNV